MKCKQQNFDPYRGILLIVSVAVGLNATGCSLLKSLPQPRNLTERLQQFSTQKWSLEHPVELRWNEHHIPWVVARSDRDLAYTLGLIHTHLRWAQMEILRRVAWGRTAEMGGPFVVEIDQALRTLGFGRTVDDIESMLPEETQVWLQAFVRGINDYAKRSSQLPHEFAVLNIQRSPWTVKDILAISRLAAADVNWLVWARLLQLRQSEAWSPTFERMLEASSEATLTFEHPVERIVASSGRSGSNSVAIAGSRTTTGAALLANDPHLGFQLPNFWLIAGYRSPSYHLVGLMIPGLPFAALGRNTNITWGGTNMRSASSDLIRVNSKTPVQTQEVDISVRWWFDSTATLRETEHGPLVSDLDLFPRDADHALALRWMGHRPSDELTAFLAANRAQDWPSFRNAFRSYAVSGQNMLYADREGNIGHVLAVRLPKRAPGKPEDVTVSEEQSRQDWHTTLGATELPTVLNPPEGFLVSANNRPTEASVPIGYFFAPDDRVKRWQALLEERPTVNVEWLQKKQTDVFMPSAIALRDAILQRSEVCRFSSSKDTLETLTVLKQWDGHYTTSSRGALVFEAMVNTLSEQLYGARYNDNDDLVKQLRGLSEFKRFLSSDVTQSACESMKVWLAEGLRQATQVVEEYQRWGKVHQLELQHPLGLAPLIGGRYRFGAFEIPGSTDTIWKTAHAPTTEPHTTFYGANARHISDMADPNANYFVLLGGQDGWLNSSTFIDQVNLYRQGRLIQVPLELDAVRAAFRHELWLEGSTPKPPSITGR